MYETLSSDYDRFVDWPSRLALELPFITNKLQVNNARTVLDAAAGTGMHAIALEQQGLSSRWCRYQPRHGRASPTECPGSWSPGAV